MPSNIRACCYVLIALIAGYYLCTTLFKNQKQDIGKITQGWVFITLFIFLIPNPAVYFILVGLVLFTIAPKQADKRFQFYCALLPAIPMNLAWRASLLNIETIMWFDHVTILSISILLPIIKQTKPVRDLHQRDEQILSSHKLFSLFLAYLVLAIVLSCRGSNVTSIIRAFMENFFNPLIFLIMANRLCRDRKVIDGVLFGILVSGVFVALVSCIEQYTKWKIYNEVSKAFIFFEHFSMNVRDIRWGMMRTPATMEPIPLGYFMGLCVVISYYFSGLRKMGNTTYSGSVIITLLFVAGEIFSGSRGAWATALLMLGLLVLFAKKFKAMRVVVLISLIVLAFSASAIMTYLAQSDPYGTFQYRLDLISNSMIVIKDNFLFGSVDFRSHPALQASKQGEGIIDVVNVYLGIALREGMVPLAMLVMVIYGTLKGLFRVRALEEASAEASAREWQARVLLVMLIGGLVMVFTVSFVDRISHYLWLTLVLGICFLGSEANTVKRSDA